MFADMARDETAEIVIATARRSADVKRDVLAAEKFAGRLRTNRR
jgi:hypothetical protein